MWHPPFGYYSASTAGCLYCLHGEKWAFTGEGSLKVFGWYNWQSELCGTHVHFMHLSINVNTHSFKCRCMQAAKIHTTLLLHHSAILQLFKMDEKINLRHLSMSFPPALPSTALHASQSGPAQCWVLSACSTGPVAGIRPAHVKWAHWGLWFGFST